LHLVGYILEYSYDARTHLLIILFLNVTNQYRICIKDVIVTIINQGQLNHGAGSTHERIKIIYTILVGKRKRQKSISDMLERGAECEGANCES